MRFPWTQVSESDEVETEVHAVAGGEPQTVKFPDKECTSTLTFGDRTFRLHPGKNVIGRSAQAEVVIESVAVSRRHAQVVIDGDRAILEDLGSKNGTFLGNRRVDLPLPIPDSAVIRLGSIWLFFRSGDGAEDRLSQ